MSKSIEPNSKHRIARHFDDAFVMAGLDGGTWNNVLDATIFLIAWNAVLGAVRAAGNSYLYG